MPLPQWAADAATKILDTENLFLIEGKMLVGDSPPKEEDVLLLARASIVEEAQRLEFHVLAVINSDKIAFAISTDETSGVHHLLQVAKPDDSVVDG